MKKYILYILPILMFFGCSPKEDYTAVFLNKGMENSYDYIRDSNLDIIQKSLARTQENLDDFGQHFEVISRINNSFQSFEKFETKIITEWQKNNNIIISKRGNINNNNDTCDLNYKINNKKQELFTMIDLHTKLLDSVINVYQFNIDLSEILDFEYFQEYSLNIAKLNIIMSRLAYADYVVYKQIENIKLDNYLLEINKQIAICIPKTKIVKYNDFYEAEIYLLSFDSIKNLKAIIEEIQYEGIGHIYYSKKVTKTGNNNLNGQIFYTYNNDTVMLFPFNLNYFTHK
jgi:GldM second domain